MKVCFFKTRIFQLGGAERLQSYIREALNAKIFTFMKEVPLEGCEEVGDSLTRRFKSVDIK